MTLIKIKEFAERTNQSYRTAVRTVSCEAFKRQGITVKTTPPNKKGGYRIHWEKFCKYMQENNNQKTWYD